MMLPYGTYAPGAAYAPAINYPYVGPRYGYRGPAIIRIASIAAHGSLTARTFMSPALSARPYLYR